ncbi:MAG TPA: transposase [Planctomycetaceae bacterium]|nr:transposase [Planctomycetaceae bacterium]
MVMVVDALPELKRLFSTLGPLGLSDASRMLMSRMVIAFVMRSGRMSGVQAAGSVRSQTRHRAQVGRFLGRKRWDGQAVNERLREALLSVQAAVGLHVFILDATLCSQQGKKTENLYSTGNKQPRPKKRRRYGKQKHSRKNVHSFTMGLLITPHGTRIPMQRAYKTKEYCQAKGLTHQTTAESGAEMIRRLPVATGTRVIVLGDTAYDAKVVQVACAERGFTWIVPCNPERVLSGPSPRPMVRSLIQKLTSKKSLRKVRFVPGQGAYAVYRRLSAHRVGPKAKPRTYYVHEERREVQSVGAVRLLFSTKEPKLTQATPDHVKILMTNDTTLTLADVIELYSLRWQIELFFKELKSTLGFHQYRFQRFACVEAWVELALTAFLYLEWIRVRQLTRRGLTEKETAWWQSQRTFGLCQAVRLASQRAELHYVADRLKTPGGIQKLKRLIHHSFPSEYRAAM